jgi:hypothetical protein
LAKVVFLNALQKKHWPPQVYDPVNQLDDDFPSSCWKVASSVWAPVLKCEEMGMKSVPCVHSDCGCRPNVKTYKTMMVHDVEKAIKVTYRQYRCTGSKKTIFSTLSDAYLTRLGRSFEVDLPWVFGKHGHVTHAMHDVLCHSMESSSGPFPRLIELGDLRIKRYTRLHAKFNERCDAVDLGPNVPRPLEMGLTEFLKRERPPHRHTVRDMWLEYTQVYPDLLRRLMDMTEIKCSFQADASGKLNKKLFLMRHGKRARKAGTRWALFSINEIGQALGLQFVSSEAHVNMEPFIQSIIETNLPNLFEETAAEGKFLCSY